MEHMKSNEMEREKYNVVPPTGKRRLKSWALFLPQRGCGRAIPVCSPNTGGGIDYVVIHCPPY